ncbi:MAG TPA: enolase C-terminal domain-like protein, partial [Mycobacteriales bacterium]|nr:enolase C-terminal domain-like protein [Mycobacteriales bacterium]
MPLITSLEAFDIRFPTSLELDGSDAMNPDPDYSAAYLVLSSDDGIAATSLVFTIGRGNDVQTAAVAALTEHIVGKPAPRTAAELARLSHDLVHDSQLRWLGPEKGVMHMAIGAVVNAAWDGAAKAAGLPLWEFLSGLSPEEILQQIDFRYLDDVLTPQRALELLQRNAATKSGRIAELKRSGYPAYTTTPGWIGYSDEKLTRLAKEAVERGFRQIKLKVGDDLDDDIRRLRIARDIVGADVTIATDANQRWGVTEAIRWMSALAPFDIAWIEEPTSPDDVLGHAAIADALAPMRVATGEHVQNRIVFKQLLQARAIAVVQIDACRVG